MRTTVNIPDGLLAQAKRLASERDTSLGEVLAASLQTYLATLERPPLPRLQIPTHPGTIVAPSDRDFTRFPGVMLIVPGQPMR